MWTNGAVVEQVGQGEAAHRVLSFVMRIRERRCGDQVARVGILEPREETFADGGVLCFQHT